MNILIPHNWLSEYLKTNLSPEELAEKFSVGGVSVEMVERVPAGKVSGQEYVYDIEVTSNRPDMLSVIGIAREGAAILNKECLLPKVPAIPNSDDLLPLKITIEEPSLCPRYLGIVLQDIEVKPSPEIIQERLQLAGLRPINNVVDITNYVMLEYGQPLHAFDLDLLKRNEKGVTEIIVRRAKEGEEIITLDKQKLELNKKMLVIADRKEPIALAGIKGGAKAEVTSRTKTIVLECANFNPVSIRQTSRQLSLQTDASVRFDKGLSPLGLEIPFARTVDLLQKWAKGKVASLLCDAYPQKVEPKKITFHFKTLTRVLGAKIPPQEVRRILSSLGFKTKGTKEKLLVSVPPWRYNDIEREEDFVEEIARIYGYHHFRGKLLDTMVPSEIRSKEFSGEERARDILVTQGFTEVYTYSFVSGEELKKSGVGGANHLRVANPLSQEFEYMRPSLLPSLLGLVCKNQKRVSQIKIFELAPIYQGKKIPYERRHLGGLIFQKKGKIDLFFELKGVIEGLLEELGVQNFQFQKKTPVFFQREAASTIQIEGKRIGFFGLLEPSFVSRFQIREKVFAFDLDFEMLLPYVSSHKTYRPLPRYPAIEFDLSIIVPEKTFWQEIKNTIRKVNDLIRAIELFDVYKGKGIGAGKKSLAFRITYRSDSQSLREEEVKEIQTQVIAELENKFKAKVREK